MTQACELSAIAARLFDTVAAMGPDTAGVSRPAFSSIETQVLEYLRAEAEQAGLVTRYDQGQT